MASLHQAAKRGKLDECRRLVEKEDKDVKEKDEVSVWLFVCLIINHKLKLASISKSFVPIVAGWQHACPLRINQWTFGSGAIFD
jgi:hypothetical protein